MGFMMKIAKIAVAALAILSSVAPASALVRIFDYTARVDQVGALVPAGTMISGSFSYDDSISPANIIAYAGWDVATYQHPSINLSMTLNGFTFSGAGSASVSNAYVDDNDVDNDSFSVAAFDQFNNQIRFSAWASDKSWLSGTSLPSNFPTPVWDGTYPSTDNGGSLPAGGLFRFFDPRQGHGFDAVVLSVTPAGLAGGVPEPATWAMLIIGFGAVGAAMRKRQSVTWARAARA